jgi:hypothetical protein
MDTGASSLARQVQGMEKMTNAIIGIDVLKDSLDCPS